MARRAARRPDPRRRHGGVHGDRLLDQRLRPARSSCSSSCRLLSAAIRWSWRETALTATALVVLYSWSAGCCVAGSQGFELAALRRSQRPPGHPVAAADLVRHSPALHPAVLSASRISRPALGEGENPLARALGLAMDATGAAGGALIVGPAGEEPCDGVRHRRRRAADGSALERPLVRDAAPAGILCSTFGRNRALTPRARGPFPFRRRVRRARLSTRRSGSGCSRGADRRGPHRHAAGLAGPVGHPRPVDRLPRFRARARPRRRRDARPLRACSTAIEAGAAARTRLSLARDVHDSIVQFLAGAAFRVEAIKRAAQSGAHGRRRPRRAQAAAGRGAGRDPRLRPRASPRPRARACRGRRRAARARRAARPAMVGRMPASAPTASEAPIPIRLQLDLQQLLREAVANAVRHGGANRIDVGLVGRRRPAAAQRRRQRLGLRRRPTASRRSSHGRSRSGSSARTARSRSVSEPGSTNILISLPLQEPPRDPSPACRRPSDDRRRARHAAARHATMSCSAAPARAAEARSADQRAEARPRCCSTSTCPTARGSTFCAGCRARASRPAVILLTAGMDESQLLAAADLEPEGMVLKTSDPGLLLECMDAVVAGKRWVDPEIAERTRHAAGARRLGAAADPPRARADRARPPGPAQPRHRRRARRHRRHGEGLSPRDLRQAPGRQPHRARAARGGADRPLDRHRQAGRLIALLAHPDGNNLR